MTTLSLIQHAPFFPKISCWSAHYMWRSIVKHGFCCLSGENKMWMQSTRSRTVSRLNSLATPTQLRTPRKLPSFCLSKTRCASYSKMCCMPQNMILMSSGSCAAGAREEGCLDCNFGHRHLSFPKSSWGVLPKVTEQGRIELEFCPNSAWQSKQCTIFPSVSWNLFACIKQVLWSSVDRGLCLQNTMQDYLFCKGWG